MNPDGSIIGDPGLVAKTWMLNPEAVTAAKLVSPLMLLKKLPQSLGTVFEFMTKSGK